MQEVGGSIPPGSTNFPPFVFRSALFGALLTSLAGGSRDPIFRPPRRLPGPRTNKVASEKDFAMSRIPSLSSPFLLGFEEIERALDRVAKAADGYPPYNIERLPRAGDIPERLRITLAVAGFSRAELEITVEENELVIRGRQKEPEQNRVFLHRGIAARQFQRTFLLADGMRIANAELSDGLLVIDVERLGEKRSVRRIEISPDATK